MKSGSMQNQSTLVLGIKDGNKPQVSKALEKFAKRNINP